jgi:hypothetical protein
MRKSLLMIAAATAALFAAPTMAANFVTSTPGPDSNAPAGLLTINFNGPVAGLSGNYQLVTGTTGTYAQPFGGNTQYLSVPQNGSGGAALLDLTGYNFGGVVTGFSFYWGSIDTYNLLQINTSLGQTNFAFTGANPPPPANGAQQDAANNRRVFFSLAPGETIQSLNFVSNGIAFEVDDLVFTGNAVPEPATWAMLISGFGLVGGAMRSSRRQTRALA